MNFICSIYHKVGQALLQSGAILMYYKVVQVLSKNRGGGGGAFLYYKVGKVVLQSKADITILGNKI